MVSIHEIRAFLMTCFVEQYSRSWSPLKQHSAGDNVSCHPPEMSRSCLCTCSLHTLIFERWERSVLSDATQLYCASLLWFGLLEAKDKDVYITKRVMLSSGNESGVACAHAHFTHSSLKGGKGRCFRMRDSFIALP